MPVAAISAEKFVKIWQSSLSLDEVQRRSGMKRNAAWMRAVRMRQRGVPLQWLKGDKSRSMNVDKLMDLAISTRARTKRTMIW